MYVYDQSDKLLSQVEISQSQELKKFLKSLGPEFELYDGYELDINQVTFLNSLLEEAIIINPENSYHLVTVGIYKWG